MTAGKIFVFYTELVEVSDGQWGGANFLNFFVDLNGCD